MLAEIVRNGRVEAVHRGAVAIVELGGKLVASSGDIERPFFARSALKPFQAAVSQRFGADLRGEDLALATASHAGLPEHLDIVRRMLDEVGLDETALRTPPDWPFSPDGRAAVALAGATEPAPIFHNCSGKHAGVLRACVASELPLVPYESFEHPIQVAVRALLEEWLGADLPEPGIDGCGLPAHVTSTADLARLFAVLATEDELADQRAAMAIHPVLIGDVGRPDGALSAAGFPAKHGAEGCIGVAVPQLGLGIAIKAWDGSPRPEAAAAAVALDHLGLLDAELAEVLHTPIFGGGNPVGEIRPVLELT